MRRLLIAACLLLGLTGLAQAQQADMFCFVPGAVSPNNWVPCSSTQPLPVTANQGTVSHASTTALANNLVAKATPGNLAGFNCTGITGAAAGYCVAYNATAAPGTGALTGSLVLDFCFFDTTARGCSLGRLSPVAYSAGIVILVTSAQGCGGLLRRCEHDDREAPSRDCRAESRCKER